MRPVMVRSRCNCTTVKPKPLQTQPIVKAQAVAGRAGVNCQELRKKQTVFCNSLTLIYVAVWLAWSLKLKILAKLASRPVSNVVSTCCICASNGHQM